MEKDEEFDVQYYKLKRRRSEINARRHKIINSLQAHRNKSARKKTEYALERLRRERLALYRKMKKVKDEKTTNKSPRYPLGNQD